MGFETSFRVSKKSLYKFIVDYLQIRSETPNMTGLIGVLKLN